MSADGQRTKWCRNIAENFNRLSRVHERYRQVDDRQTDDRQTVTDGRPMKYSEREHEFTFAKNETLKPETETHLHFYLMFLPCDCMRKMSVRQTIGLRENESA